MKVPKIKFRFLCLLSVEDGDSREFFKESLSISNSGLLDGGAWVSVIVFSILERVEKVSAGTLSFLPGANSGELDVESTFVFGSVSTGLSNL